MWYERGVDLPDSVTTLEHAGTTYHVVGTAHVSQRSVDEVREVIDDVKPDVVCVELDKGRYDALTKDSAFRDLDVFKVVREGKTLYLLAHLALASYQRRIGASLGVKPGAELVAAVDAAKQHGIPFELIDRDIQITLKRTWKNIGLWRRIDAAVRRCVAGGEDQGEPVTAETVENLKEPKALSEMLTELGNAVPEVKGPLVDERDQYLASKMVDAGTGKTHGRRGRRRGARPRDDRAPRHAGRSRGARGRASARAVVADREVGRAARVPRAARVARHADERRDVRQDDARVDHPDLDRRRRLRRWSRAARSSACCRRSPPRRSPGSTRSCGTAVVVGIVEAWRRKPSVQDCERLQDDVQTSKGFWRNPVTRILIIAVASGLGALVGLRGRRRCVCDPPLIRHRAVIGNAIESDHDDHETRRAAPHRRPRRAGEHAAHPARLRRRQRRARASSTTCT